MMTPAEFFLRLANVLPAAMVAGGQLTVLWVIVPVKRRFEAPLSVRMHQAMLGHQIDRFMKVFAITAFLAGVTILILGMTKRLTIAPVSLALTSLGLAGTIAIVIASEGFNVPINRTMDRWTSDTIPEDYPRIRNRWDRVHAVRTCCGVFTFTAYVLAAFLR